MANGSYQAINLTTNITFSWPAAFGGLVITDRVDVTQTADDFIITMPPANQGGIVMSFFNFFNKGDYSFTINDNVGNLITEVATGTIYQVTLTAATTQGGTWDAVPYQAGETSIVNMVIESSDDSVSIAGSPVTAPNGTVDITLSASLNSLQGLDSLGFPALIDLDPMTWTSRIFVAGGTGNIVITNPAGTADNVVVDLNTNITGLDSLGIGNFVISGSTIAAAGEDTGLTINSDGTGLLALNTATIDTSGNIVANSLTLESSLISPFVCKAIAAVTDTITGESHVIAPIFGGTETNLIISYSSQGTYQCNFVTTRSDANYTASVDTSSTGADQPLVLHGYFINSSKTTTGFLVVIVDASGELITSVPDGFTVRVYAAT